MCDTVDLAREMAITIFNDSAAMPGNEAAFEAALNIFERRVREDAVLAAAEWLKGGAPIAAKWLRHDFLEVQS